MTATDVIARARSIADIPNSKLITADDELDSINESYHDLYEWLLQNDDDYYLTETTIVLTASMASSTNLGLGEYWVPLPADFKSLRYLDYNSNGQWNEITKFPITSRTSAPASPQYRIRGAYLWIVGGFNISAGYTIRIGYYPIPENITLPTGNIQYGTSYSRAAFQNITPCFYTSLNQSMVYVINATAITYESFTSNALSSPVTMYNESTTVGAIQYYKGYLYWLRGANIYRASTALATIATASVAALTSTNDVTDFAIIKDTIYFTVAAAVHSCTLAGASIASLGAATGPVSPTVIGSSVYYVDSSGNLMLVGNSTVIKASVTSATTDGTYIYLNTLNTLTRATITSTTLGTEATLSGDCLYAGRMEWSITSPSSSIDQAYIPIITRETPGLYAIGAAPPHNFSYPNNLFTEIMSYQCALDFKIKAKQDPAMIGARLGSRDGPGKFTGLWMRFYQSLRRDDYQPQRIGNRYRQPWGIW